MQQSFADEIHKLIRSGREGIFWDFKREYHDNKAELLHDIICFANALHKGNKYLIFGVTDHSTGCKVVGIGGNRKYSQADLIDFIRTMKFAGDIRPEVELRTIVLQEREVDVLVIFDRREKPYYLYEDYRVQGKCVRANYIYSRKLDTNTPIDKSVDIRSVEVMWRERFGLDITPSERMVELLRKPQEWDKDLGNKDTAYHKFSPEYQIEFGSVEQFTYPEIYSYFYHNPTSFLAEAKFKYLSTELFRLHYVYCDEMRVTFTMPQSSYVRVGSRKIYYMYYILQSRDGAFLEFLTEGTLNFNSRGTEAAFVIFRNDEEKHDFETFLTRNIERLDLLPKHGWGEYASIEISRDNRKLVYDPIEMVKVVELHKQWKREIHQENE